MGLGFSPVSFFSFFTNLTNVIVSVILIISALALLRGREPSERDDLIRGAGVVYITVVGLVYVTLLRWRRPGCADALDQHAAAHCDAAGGHCRLAVPAAEVQAHFESRIPLVDLPAGLSGLFAHPRFDHQLVSVPVPESGDCRRIRRRGAVLCGHPCGVLCDQLGLDHAGESIEEERLA